MRFAFTHVQQPFVLNLFCGLVPLAFASQATARIETVNGVSHESDNNNCSRSLCRKLSHTHALSELFFLHNLAAYFEVYNEVFPLININE